MKIEGSVILVTGGASGIGEFIARSFYEKGGVVYICDLNEERGNQMQTSTNSKIRFIKCDISDENSVRNLVETIKKEQGRIDILVNSAGILKGEYIATNKATHSTSNFELLLKVNLLGTFMVAKYVAKLMIETSDPNKDCNGNIIMIASIAGIEGQKGQSAYSASKGGVIGLTLPMARDLGKYKIRVNCVAPGVIATPMSAGMEKTKFGQMILNNTPLQTYGKPIHVSQTVEFVVVNDYVNGTTIRVDGGCRLPHF